MIAYTQDNTISFLSFTLLPEEIQDGFTTEEQENDDGTTTSVEVPVMIPNPAIEGLTPIEYDGTTITDPILEDGKIVQRPHIETPDEKYQRIFSTLVALETLDETTDPAILEGVKFTDTQKGDLIVAREFKDSNTGLPNPHGQTAMFSKIFSGNTDPAFLATVQEKTIKTNQILAFFHMSHL